MPEIFWLAYRGMSDEDRDVFWSKFLEDDSLRGELLDTILLAERSGGPYHPEYETFLTEVEAERAAVKTKSHQ